MTGIKLLSAVIAEFWYQAHVLKHFFANHFRCTSGRHNTLEDLIRKTIEGRLFPNCREELLECVDDLDGRVVIRRTVNALSQSLLLVEEYTLHKFARVVFCAEQGYRRVVRHRECETPFAIGHLAEAHARKVRHVEAGQEVGCWDPERTDILFDVGFAVKMIDSG